MKEHLAELKDLRAAALEIFREALKSVDAYEAVRRAVSLKDSRLEISRKVFDPDRQAKNFYAIACGKAALPMAAALEDALGENLTVGVLSGTISDNALSNSSSIKRISGRWRLFAGGHPVPNEESLMAARAAFELLRRAEEERALVIFLISGGGSAMMEWPRDERITLEDLRAANRALVSCGASIAEVNAVRRAFSAVKGGGLSLRAPNSHQVSLIISDTNAGEEAYVASGPTFIAPEDAPDPRRVVERYSLETKLPQSILSSIKDYRLARAEASNAFREFFVLLNNESALEAAAVEARGRGFIVEFARDLVEQQVDEGCASLISRLNDLKRRHEGELVCLLSGGEFACPVKGCGLGGRNSESALRCSIEIERLKESGHLSSAVVLSAGTDGVDGNSPAAGAIADSLTMERARLLNLRAEDFLSESDSFSFFERLGDAIITGPTGTNVRDLRVCLAS